MTAVTHYTEVIIDAGLTLVELFSTSRWAEERYAELVLAPPHGAHEEHSLARYMMYVTSHDRAQVEAFLAEAVAFLAPLVPMDALHTCVERPVRDDGVIAAWRGDVLVWFRFDPPAGQSHKSYCNDNFWGFLETEGFACIFATEVTALLFLEENGIETLATPLQE